MAIYGAGSMWSGQEMKDEFFRDEKFEIGWNYAQGMDLYEVASLLKAGDIIYLKAAQAGSRHIRVKGIGFVKQAFIHKMFKHNLTTEDLSGYQSFSVDVKWVLKEEFHIDIDPDDGRLTNIRNATFYEEPLPKVQKEILDHVFGLII